MDSEINFRALLIKLQDSLSDNDRRRLHFLFGNIIPRRLRDDLSINGTLDLLESLIDRGKINDQDIDFLIYAFQKIDCHHIAKRLQKHARDIQKYQHIAQPTLSQQVLNDIEDDKISSTASQQKKLLMESDISIENGSSSLSPLNSPGNIKQNNTIIDQSLQMRKKWNYWKIIVITFIIVAILAIILLCIIIFVRKQSKIPKNYMNNNVNIGPNYLHTMKTTPVILGYFTSWSIYNRQYFVYNISADKITHINYAFASINSDGLIEISDPNADVSALMPGDTWDQSLRGNFNQLIKLKKKYPHLNILISIGGYDGSSKFSDVAMNTKNRVKFAASCVEFVKKYDFNGIDISWIYPVSGGSPKNIHRPEDKQNYVLLLKELRKQLDAVKTKKYLLTIQGGTGEYIKNMNLSSMIIYLDWINVLTYDFHGNWESKTNHHAALYRNNEEERNDIILRLNCDAAIQTYLEAGVPSNKIVMSIPLYGRGWQGVNKTARNGYLQLTSSAIPYGTWGAGVFDYDHLKKDFIPSYKRYFDDQSKVPYLFNLSTGIWISYEDLESIDWKIKYIKDRRLRGVSFWELSNDRQAELIGAVFNGLTNGIDVTSIESFSSNL